LSVSIFHVFTFISLFKKISFFYLHVHTKIKMISNENFHFLKKDTIINHRTCNFP
jgi:hypothetical protein